MELSNNLSRRLCAQLLEYDPGIVEIVQFGSSIYAPESARDLDLLVFTREKRGYGGYLAALDGLGLPFDLDVIVIELGEPLGRLRLGAYRVLYGEGHYLRGLAGLVEREGGEGDPSFTEAKDILAEALEDFKLALERERPARRDWKLRTAFNELFEAARLASMAYLSLEETRWGRIKRGLPRAYREEFQEYIDRLHIKYFYLGGYPKGSEVELEEEFNRWYTKVEGYIQRLEQEARERKDAGAGAGG
jgi:hypothetical protein